MSENFETGDFNLAATIIATLGTPILAIEHGERGNVKFIFSRDHIADEYVDAYWRGDLKVEPIVHSLARQYLRSRVKTVNEGEDESIPKGLCM